jgi:hypothetical protein
MRDEWFLADEREADAASDRRRAQRGKPQGASPFVVCDMQHSKPGAKCKATIESLLGENLTPLINKVDMTCFAVEALASDVKSLPVGLSAVPLSPEMKMARGLVESIASSVVPLVKRIDATFCAGETSTNEEAYDLAQELLNDLLGDRRHLRAQSFLESRIFRDAERDLFWQRQLQDAESLSSSVCREMITTFSLEAFKSGMTLTLPDGDLSESYRECISAVVVDLAMQPEVCFVGGYQRIQLRNDVASGIVQGGHSDVRPLHALGLDGTGQVVAMSDTGVDTDNCYFYDADTEVTKSRSDAFDLKARKIVQYVAYADSKDSGNGHGTHVAGSIVGQKASDGRQESSGKGDGVAKGAKLSVFDIQNGTSQTNGNGRIGPCGSIHDHSLTQHWN